MEVPSGFPLLIKATMEELTPDKPKSYSHSPTPV